MGPREIAALYAEVYARPDDDAPRLVLADALQAIGDPRGELIALQLPAHHPAPPPGFEEEVEEFDELHGLRGLGESFAGPDRIRALVRRYGVAWLGPLAKIASRADFTRGFPSRLELSNRDPRVDDPSLATIEELLPGALSGHHYARLVTSPAAVALRRIEMVDADVVHALASTPARLEHVAVPDRPRYAETFAGVIAPALARFESLRSVAIHTAVFDSLADTPILDRLTSLTLAGDVDTALALWNTLPAHVELRIAATATLAPLQSGLESPPIDAREIHLRREGDAVIARLEGRWVHGYADLVCARVRGLTHVELVSASTEVYNQAIERGLRATSVSARYSHAVVDVSPR